MSLSLMLSLRMRTTVCATLASLLIALTSSDGTHANAADIEQKRIVYREKLAEYTKAHLAFEKLARPYWESISEKRTRRLAKQANDERSALSDYVLEQPPVYTGPPEPEDPEKKLKPSAEYVPVIADFLQHAKEQFNFAPELPANDDDYRRGYATAALAAGLTPEQCVKIYAFESGGDGGYSVQAGLEYDRPGAKAITTALGYNQLLTTNSIELLAEAGDEFLSALRKEAEEARGQRQSRLLDKIVVLERMIAFSRSVPDRWGAHSRLAGTAKGLGVHALILDVDIGPLLQVQKLLTSVAYAKSRDYTAPLTAAELEMMNLTGDGNGFDMVSMPDDVRNKVPTSNFFQRGGYERNPVAIVNNTVAKLLAATDAKMITESQLQGAKALAAAFKEFN